MSTSGYPSQAPDSIPPLVHQDNQAVVTRAPSQPEHPTTDRKPVKRRRTSHHKGDIVEVREVVGRKFKSSSKYGSKKIWQGDGPPRNHVKNNHRSDFDNGDGTYTCCGKDFDNEQKVLEHILEEDMEDVVTVGPRSELPWDAIETPVLASVPIPGPTVSPPVDASPPVVTYPQGQLPAHHYASGSMYAQPMPGLPAVSSISNYGATPISMAQSLYAPQIYSPSHDQQFNSYGNDGAFNQITATHGSLMSNVAAYHPMAPAIPNPATFPAPRETHGNTLGHTTDSLTFDPALYNLAFDHTAHSPQPYYLNPSRLRQRREDANYMYQ